MRTWAFLMIPVLWLTAGAATSGQASSTASEAFERLRSLEGRWVGRMDDRENGEQIVIEYRVVAGGQALIEYQGPGTPMEMMTVYYLAGNELRATHYCAMGNQPTMVWTTAKDHRVERFEFTGGTGFDPARDGHVHDGEVRFQSAHEIEHYWTFYQNGEKKSDTRWYLRREVRPKP